MHYFHNLFRRSYQYWILSLSYCILHPDSPEYGSHFSDWYGCYPHRLHSGSWSVIHWPLPDLRSHPLLCIGYPRFWLPDLTPVPVLTARTGHHGKLPGSDALSGIAPCCSTDSCPLRLLVPPRRYLHCKSYSSSLPHCRMLLLLKIYRLHSYPDKIPDDRLKPLSLLPDFLSKIPLLRYRFPLSVHSMYQRSF